MKEKRGGIGSKKREKERGRDDIAQAMGSSVIYLSRRTTDMLAGVRVAVMGFASRILESSIQGSLVANHESCHNHHQDMAPSGLEQRSLLLSKSTSPFGIDESMTTVLFAVFEARPPLLPHSFSL